MRRKTKKMKTRNNQTRNQQPFETKTKMHFANQIHIMLDSSLPTAPQNQLPHTFAHLHPLNILPFNTSITSPNFPNSPRSPLRKTPQNPHSTPRKPPRNLPIRIHPRLPLLDPRTNQNRHKNRRTHRKSPQRRQNRCRRQKAIHHNNPKTSSSSHHTRLLILHPRTPRHTPRPRKTRPTHFRHASSRHRVPKVNNRRPRALPAKHGRPRHPTALRPQKDGSSVCGGEAGV
ncbi:hypothetical protein BCR33DRAFT_479784 [Rhizoclosmatium globosum]|uniref:Uncharacterized protein n=1 Tax=Rhizoclosmatium globosum TaxID=329046 RepID=A0A1Y2BNF3_9FUNG|nr:hypothetical protein BCR33DRAFT_479784 [Rhizoclosmatium globosum]|eukprot:ORY36289.1 hypothetical protein BCR33DRAFT_479784 [Rhizoclosmatium globosum]